MTQVSGIDDAALLAPPPSQKARDELGQEDFLKLMITQFRNQDPFEPMDNGAFLGQLAQFGTVNGIEQLNGAFAGLSTSIQSEQVLQAANLVGRSVLARTDSGYVAAGGALSGAVELNGSSSNVQVEITNASGELVRRLELGAHESGLAHFEWDGRDASQEPVEAGHYTITSRVVRGTNVESAETLLDATIESVNLGQFGQGMTLNLPGGDTLTLDQIRRIL